MAKKLARELQLEEEKKEDPKKREMDAASKRLIEQIQEMERFQVMSQAMVRDGQMQKIDFTSEDELAKAIAKGEDGDEEQKECGICMEVLDKDLTVISNCDHVIHKECMQMYLQAEI